jgi:hypothetical protein
MMSHFYTMEGKGPDEVSSGRHSLAPEEQIDDEVLN